jgi:hypothetical protein
MSASLKCEPLPKEGRRPGRARRVSRPPKQTPRASRPESPTPSPSRSTALSNAEDFLAKVPVPPLYGSAEVPLCDLLAWYAHVFSMEQGYRSASAARNAAVVTLDEASAHADAAYGRRQDALQNYLALVEKLVAGKASSSSVADPARSRAPTKRKRGEQAKSVPRTRPRPRLRVDVPAVASSRKGKEKAVIPAILITDDDEEGGSSSDPMHVE